MHTSQSIVYKSLTSTKVIQQLGYYIF